MSKQLKCYAAVFIEEDNQLTKLENIQIIYGRIFDRVYDATCNVIGDFVFTENDKLLFSPQAVMIAEQFLMRYVTELSESIRGCNEVSPPKLKEETIAPDNIRNSAELLTRYFWQYPQSKVDYVLTYPFSKKLIDSGETGDQYLFSQCLELCCFAVSFAMLERKVLPDIPIKDYYSSDKGAKINKLLSESNSMKNLFQMTQDLAREIPLNDEKLNEEAKSLAVKEKQRLKSQKAEVEKDGQIVPTSLWSIEEDRTAVEVSITDDQIIDASYRIERQRLLEVQNRIEKEKQKNETTEENSVRPEKLSRGRKRILQRPESEVEALRRARNKSRIREEKQDSVRRKFEKRQEVNLIIDKQASEDTYIIDQKRLALIKEIMAKKENLSYEERALLSMWNRARYKVISELTERRISDRIYEDLSQTARRKLLKDDIEFLTYKLGFKWNLENPQECRAIVKELIEIRKIWEVENTSGMSKESRNEINEKFRELVFSLFFGTERNEEVFQRLFSLKNILADFPSEESKDQSSIREIFEFLTKTRDAFLCPLPKFELKSETNEERVEEVLRQLMIFWKADPFALNNLNQQEIKNALQTQEGKTQFNATLFACLFCQISRLAEKEEDRAKYVTLNPLRSDFPSILPYLILLQRSLREACNITLNIQLIVGNTDDEDALSQSEELKQLFTSQVQEEAKKRQGWNMQKFQLFAEACGIQVSVSLYSDYMDRETRKTQMEVLQTQFDRYSENIYVQGRIDQEADMLRNAQESGNFNKLFQSVTDDLSRICNGFAGMYLLQGRFLQKLRSDGYFLLDTIRPAQNCEIYCLIDGGLTYPSTNIFPINR